MHAWTLEFVSVIRKNHVCHTSSSLLCFCLQEIHAHNKSIQPCGTGVKEETDSHRPLRTMRLYRQDLDMNIVKV